MRKSQKRLQESPPQLTLAEEVTSAPENISEKPLVEGLPEESGVSLDDPPSSKSERQSIAKTTSRSRKSGVGSQPQLDRTTKRSVVIEELDYEHLRYVYAANKQGVLKSLDKAFHKDLPVEQFNDLFRAFIVRSRNHVFVAKAPTEKGLIPVGMVFVAPIKNGLIITNTVWFWWASHRNIVETAAHFFRMMRDQIVVMFYVEKDETKFPEYLKRLGVIRSVGRLHDLLDGPAHLYQTRRVK